MPHHETIIVRREEHTMVQRIAGAIAEWRASWAISAKSPEVAALFGATTTTSSSSGISVSEYTALNYSAVWAAVSIISSDVGSLPLLFYRRLPNGGKERYEGHPLYRILHDEPNPEMTAMVFRETLTAHLLLWGNAYAEIERDTFGRPAALWPITPDRIYPYRESDGRLRYHVHSASPGLEPQTPDVILEMRDVLHIPGLGYDGLVGYSVVAKARESFGVGAAAEKFGSSFFGNGSTFGGVFSHPGKLSPLARENFVKSIEARHTGIEKAHRFVLVEEGMKFENSMGVNPTDAQFLETRQFQVSEVARWFQIPPHKIGDLEHATFTNIEEQNIDYYRSGLRRWLVRWEQELNRKLIAKSEKNLQFAEHLVEGFLRGNSAARSEYYAKMFGIGVLSINDIREFENANPIGTDGDAHFVPLNMTPVAKAIEGPPAPAAPPAPPAAVDPNAPGADGTPARDALAEALGVLQAKHNETLDDLVAIREKHADALVQLQTSVQQFATVSADLHTSEVTRTILVEAALHAEHERVTAAAAYERTIAEGRDKLAAAEAAWAEVLGTAETLRGELATVHGQVGDLITRLHDRDRDVALMTAERDRVLTVAATDVAAVTAERDQELAKRATTIAHIRAQYAEQAEQLAAAEGLVASLTDERNEARALLSAAGLEIVATRLDRDRALADAAARDQDARARETVIEGLRAEVAKYQIEAEHFADAVREAGTRIEAAEAEVLTEATRAAEAIRRADKAIAAEALSASAHALAASQLAASEAARAEAETVAVRVREQERERLGRVMAAQRGLIADVLQRLIEREIDRVRRHVATAGKLRAWMGQFYSTHEDACTEALLPAVRVAMAWQLAPEDPIEATRAIARTHVKESVDQLTAAIEGAAADEVHPFVERLMQRWHDHRATARADAILAGHLAFLRAYERSGT